MKLFIPSAEALGDGCSREHRAGRAKRQNRNQWVCFAMGKPWPAPYFHGVGFFYTAPRKRL